MTRTANSGALHGGHEKKVLVFQFSVVKIIIHRQYLLLISIHVTLSLIGTSSSFLMDV